MKWIFQPHAHHQYTNKVLILFLSHCLLVVYDLYEIFILLVIYHTK